MPEMIEPSRPRVGRKTRALWRTAIVVLAGCTSSSGPSVLGAPIVGTWEYSSTQTSPTPATLLGTLTVAAQTDRGVNGTFDGVERVLNAAQPVQRLGSLTGRFLDSTAVELTLTLSTEQRQHLGRVSGDTLRGSWNVRGGGPSGDFVAVRRRP
jgi:hypothetical protein